MSKGQLFFPLSGVGGGVGGERLCSNNKVDINMQNCQCVCLFIMC